jgi:hypothetical protein
MSQGIYKGWYKGTNVLTTFWFIFVDWDFFSLFVKESYLNALPFSSYTYVYVIPELCLHQELHLLRSSFRFCASESFWEAKHSIFFVPPRKTDRPATFVLTPHLAATKSCCSSFMYSSQLFMKRVIRNQLPDTYRLEVQMPWMTQDTGCSGIWDVDLWTYFL